MATCYLQGPEFGQTAETFEPLESVLDFLKSWDICESIRIFDLETWNLQKIVGFPKLSKPIASFFRETLQTDLLILLDLINSVLRRKLRDAFVLLVKSLGKSPNSPGDSPQVKVIEHGR